MNQHFNLHASGIAYRNGEKWQYRFGVFVSDENGQPVNHLKSDNFTIFEITEPGDGDPKSWALDLRTLIMSGLYEVVVEGPNLDIPQYDRLFAIRTTLTPGLENWRQGMTTVSITSFPTQ